MHRIGGILVFLTPLIITILLDIFGIINIYEVIKNYSERLIPVIGILLYPFIFMLTAFTYKRRLFIYDIHDINVYKLEDELFHLLEKEKNRELPVDIISGSILLIFLLIIYFSTSSNYLSFDISNLIFYFACLVCIIGFIYGLKIRQREHNW